MEVSKEEFKKLGVIEKVEFIENLLYLKYTSSEIKERLGIDKNELCRLRRVSRKTSDTVKSIVKKGRLFERHVRAVINLPPAKQESFLRDAIAKRWSADRLTMEVKGFEAGKQGSSDNSYYEQLSEKISTQIGHPVIVTPSKNDQAMGTIQITYLGYDAFDGIMARLRVKLEEDF